MKPIKKIDLNNGLGLIDPDLVEEYVLKKEQLAKQKNRRKIWLRTLSVAACLCVIIGAILAFPILRTDSPTPPNDETTGIIDLTRPPEPSASILIDNANGKPTTIFSHVMSFRLTAPKSIYTPDESPLFELTCGLQRKVPVDGIIKLFINTGELSTTAPQEITLGRLNYNESPSFKLDIPLTAPAKSNIYGKIDISFVLYPDDLEAPELSMFKFDESGALCLNSIRIAYAANKYEIAFMPYYDGYQLAMNRMSELLKSSTISTEEFAKMYYAMQLTGTVNSDLYVEHWNGSFHYFYFSENIRFKSSKLIFNDELKAASESGDRKLFATLALAQLKESGVITEKEYKTELELFENAKFGNEYRPGRVYSVEVDRIVLQDLYFTHFD